MSKFLIDSISVSDVEQIPDIFMEHCPKSYTTHAKLVLTPFKKFKIEIDIISHDRSKSKSDIMEIIRQKINE